MFSILGHGLQLRDIPEEVKKACKGQYVKRGCPVQWTGWTPVQCHAYIKWQVRHQEELDLDDDELGGFAWHLPRKQEDGRPADLPDYVLNDSLPPPDWAGWKERRTPESDEDDLDPELVGYKLQHFPKDDVSTLTHVLTKVSVDLDYMEGSSIRTNSFEGDVITGPHLDDNTCWQVMNECGKSLDRTFMSSWF